MGRGDIPGDRFGDPGDHQLPCPLALHDIDAISGADVGDGLVAIAWPHGDPTSARIAVRSPLSTGTPLAAAVAAYQRNAQLARRDDTASARDAAVTGG